MSADLCLQMLSDSVIYTKFLLWIDFAISGGIFTGMWIVETAVALMFYEVTLCSPPSLSYSEVKIAILVGSKLSI